MNRIYILCAFATILLSCETAPIETWTIEQPLHKDVPAHLRSTDFITEFESFIVKDPSSSKQWMAQQNGDLLIFVPDIDLKEGSTLQLFQGEESNGSIACQIQVDDSFITATIDDQIVLKYAISVQMPADSLPSYYQRSGFVHPLSTRQGRMLTAGFPEGHVHQHGLFNAWTRTTYKGQQIDFWNQQNELGTVRHQSVGKIINGPVFSSFEVHLQHVAYLENGDTSIALDETWTMQIYPLENDYLIDWALEQSCHGPDTLQLDEYHYGGAAFRGNEIWNVEDGAFDSLVFFRTDAGLTHMDGNHSRPKWVSMYGAAGNGSGGIAMMGHPQNFRHPQPVRVHPKMPYFVFTPSVLGTFQIAPEEHYRSKYRLVVFDGVPSDARINLLQASFVSE